ncbi:LANO_0E06370g1_1 [Lachancea nothofagi CBS 11611]|uniref:LANO_0E06370g1_1 n=1 Tax=Lachancea nothofagi CBS 11611 TaxID=1266666 RepID=A0A1G4JTR9_9SACH|nr:LANO_0E06370g1_1 [Lachancea nothofagi CBS 11611]
MVITDSSLEIIEANDKDRGNDKDHSINLIELNSATDDFSTAGAPVLAAEYPSSPKINVSSPTEVNEVCKQFTERSEELSYAFQNDTALENSSLAIESGPKTASIIHIGESSLDYSNITNKSSPVMPKTSQKLKSALDQILGDDVPSSSDITDGQISLPQSASRDMSVAALGLKWSQKEVDTHDGSPLRKFRDRSPKLEPAVRDYASLPSRGSLAPVTNSLFVHSSQTDLSASNMEGQWQEDGRVTFNTNEHSLENVHAHKKDADDAIEDSSVILSPEGINLNSSPWKPNLRISKKRSPSYQSRPLFKQSCEPLSQCLHDKYKNFIVNGKYFTDEESRKEVAKSLSTAPGKKKYNAVNKLVKDAVTLKTEMILDMDESLYRDFEGDGIDLRQELLPTQIIHTHETKALIKLRRSCKSIYDYNHGIFYPIKESVVNETVSILYYDALDFFHQFATQRTLFMEIIQGLKGSNQLVLVVLSGRDQLVKCMQKIENKRFREQVDEELNGPRPKRNQSKTRRTQMLEDLSISADDIDKEIDRLVVCLGVHFFATESNRDFLVWLNSFIIVVGKKRYDPVIRHQEWSHINLRSAQDPQDALGKTLEQLDQMTRLKAQRVVSVYKNFQQLHDDIEKGYLTSGNDGNSLMASATEKAVVTLLTSENPEDLVYLS